VQTDIKRVLAYSTVSQLGYMFLGCGVAAYASGVFHLVTHAFFKALLFLAAGSVIHALSGEQDMRVMGGLRKKIPVTFWTMTAAVVAIAGFPPFAGFVSKDEILYQAFVSSDLGKVLWFIGLATAGLTSFYMFRLWYLTFFGESRADEGHALSDHGAAVHASSTSTLVMEAGHDDSHGHGHSHGVHESPWIMLGPLAILAVLSVLGGFLGWPEALGGGNWIGHFLAPVTTSTLPVSEGSRSLEMILALVSTLVAVSGWLVAHVLYYAKPELPALIAQKLRILYAVLVNKYWVDEIYGAVVVTPVLLISRYLLKAMIDRGVIDGGGLAAGYSIQGLGALVARIQSGNIRSYAGWLALFAAVLLIVTYFGFTAHLSFR
jgi:NADH-quinone oxidoreductase subunit L